MEIYEICIYDLARLSHTILILYADDIKIWNSWTTLIPSDAHILNLKTFLLHIWITIIPEIAFYKEKYFPHPAKIR